MGMIHLRTAQI